MLCGHDTAGQSQTLRAPEGTRPPALKLDFERSWPRCAGGGGEGHTSCSSSDRRMSHCAGRKARLAEIQPFALGTWCGPAESASQLLTSTPQSLPCALQNARGKRRAPRPARGGGPGFQPGGREGQKDLASVQSPTGPAPPWAHSLRRHWGCRGHDRAQTAGCAASSQRLASSPHWPEAAGAAKALAMVGGGRGSLSGSTG